MPENGFEMEERSLQRSLDYLSQKKEDQQQPTASPDLDELSRLAEDYRRLLRQSRKLMRISDRLQLQLSETNDALRNENEKNRSLQTIIRQFIPRNTWEKADLNSQAANLEIPNEEVYRTCMFVDVVSFTKFSESRTPQEVVDTLNSVFSPIVETIQAYGGDIDKFIGDSIFAIFTSAQDALLAAVRIQHWVNTRRQLSLRIGLHTGHVLIGNVGGESRKDNTYMGDNVNISSRLQTHALPGGIMLSRACLEAAELRELHPELYEITKTPLYVRGRAQPIQVVQIEPNSIPTPLDNQTIHSE